MSYEWQGLFQEAVLETDFEKLLERIEAAEKSIAQRSLFGKKLTVGECLELETALYQLRALRQERTEIQASHTAMQKRSKLGHETRRQQAP
jgi:hypothetical protein